MKRIPLTIDRDEREQHSEFDRELLNRVHSAALSSSKLALSLEFEREKSCITQSGLTITGLSAFSIFAATVFASLTEEHMLPNAYIWSAFFAVVLLFLASLLFSILVLFRPKKAYSKSPRSMYSYYIDNQNEFDSTGVIESECNLFDSLWKPLDKANKRRILFLHLSLAFFVASIALFFLAIMIPFEVTAVSKL